jgi:hypothetical protein
METHILVNFQTRRKGDEPLGVLCETVDFEPFENRRCQPTSTVFSAPFRRILEAGANRAQRWENTKRPVRRSWLGCENAKLEAWFELK